jgi:hypothetical protein
MGMATKRKRGKGVGATKPKAKQTEAVRVVVYLRPEQLTALQEYAMERAQERGAVSLSVSDAARSVLEDWIAKRR